MAFIHCLLGGQVPLDSLSDENERLKTCLLAFQMADVLLRFGAWSLDFTDHFARGLMFRRRGSNTGIPAGSVTTNP
jgi:hypothetical protein